MSIFMSEAEVRARLSLEEAKGWVEAGLAATVGQPTTVVPRARLPLPAGTFQWLAASVPRVEMVGAKLYTTVASTDGEQRSSVIVAFDAQSGRRLAVIESYHLSLIRTAVMTSLATRYLAPPRAHTLGLIGTGGTAVLQVEAVLSERPFDRVLVHSRTAQRRERLAEAISAERGVAAHAASTAEEVVAAADVLITATDSADPILRRQWLHPGMLVNAIGSNYPVKRELPADAVAGAGHIVVDALPSARTEAGDLVLAAKEGQLDWSAAQELGDIIAAGTPRPPVGGWTIFKSVGVAAQDLMVVAGLVASTRENPR